MCQVIARLNILQALPALNKASNDIYQKLLNCRVWIKSYGRLMLEPDLPN